MKFHRTQVLALHIYQSKSSLKICRNVKLRIYFRQFSSVIDNAKAELTIDLIVSGTLKKTIQVTRRRDGAQTLIVLLNI